MVKYQVIVSSTGDIEDVLQGILKARYIILLMLLKFDIGAGKRAHVSSSHSMTFPRLSELPRSKSCKRCPSGVPSYRLTGKDDVIVIGRGIECRPGQGVCLASAMCADAAALHQPLSPRVVTRTGAERGHGCCRDKQKASFRPGDDLMRRIKCQDLASAG